MQNNRRGLLFFLGVLMLFIPDMYSQAYKTAFRTDICQCMEEESLKRHLTANAYKNCFKETLPKYANQIDAAIVETDLNKKYYLGQVARKDLIIAMEYELVYSCSVYYDYLDRKRTSEKLIARENAKESELETLNQAVAMSPTAYSYFYRAQVQFNLGNLKAAAADINKSLEVNPNAGNIRSTRHELLLLAWVYEEQNQYSKAVALYDSIYMGDLDTQVAILRALANKKGGGSMSSIPKQDVEEKAKVSASTRRRPTTQNTSAKTTIPKTRKSTVRKQEKVQVQQKTDSSSLKKLFKL